MTKDVLIMALSAFLHDIGKFAKKAGMPVSEDFKKNSLDLYCDFDKENNILSHEHSLYTASFLNWLENEIPAIFKNQNIDNVSLLNLASAHHKPSNVLESIITIADELSNGCKREKFENRSTGLISIFEEIDFNDSPSASSEYSFGEYKYKYPLSRLNPQSIFPQNNNELGSYTELFENFKKEILKLVHTDNLELWLEHLDSLLMKYASSVPSSSFSQDVSLYDHCKTVSAFASSLYLYHKQNNTFNNENINNENEKKFIYLKSKFHGIQEFIFSQGGWTNENSAKILRGRSFYISLLMELAGDMLCKNTGVHNTSIIMNAAGCITMILPNTPWTKEKIKDTEDQINDWLIKNFYGEVSIGFAYIEASPADFKSNSNLNEDILSEKLSQKLELKKFKKIDIKYFGKMERYFGNDDVLCKFCGKRPASTTEKKCPVCIDLTNIGEKLVKNSQIIIINQSDSAHNILKVPIYGQYGICFEDEKKYYLQNPAPSSLMRYWSFVLNDCFVAFKPFKAYVPVFDKEKTVKTFEDIVKPDDAKKSVEALGILKCDVDNLGKIFQIGISKRHGSGLSKTATFSRIINSFFTIYLPDLLSVKYKNIYTVFAGGDDLFLIGRWDTVINLSYELKNAFNKFSCNNPQVTFSTGIAIAKPNEMIRSLYFYSEQALKQSKDNAGKDSLTIFDETIKWSQKNELISISDNLSKWQKDEILNSAALFKILSFIDMAQKTDVVNKKIGNTVVNLSDMQNFKWKALLNYFLTRNNAVKKQPSIVRDFVNQINSNSRSSLKIAIWKNIYKNRIRG